jgi:hypothetical protein
MKQRALTLSSVLGLLGILLAISAFSSHASGNNRIECQTAFGEKKFFIQEGQISFYVEEATDKGRSISSVNFSAVRTHNKQNGFTKTLYIEGLKHKINIENQTKFSETNDYLSITSPKGHEMTYPLNCHSA